MRFSKDVFKGIVIGIVFTLGLSISIGVSASSNTYKMLHAYFNNIKINVGGKDITLTDQKGRKIEPFIVDGVTYLPVRGVAEALGEKISWDNKNWRVTIGETVVQNNKGYKTVQELDWYEKSRDIFVGGVWDKSGKIEMRQKEYVSSSNIRSYAGLSPIIYNLDGNYNSITGLFGVDDLAESGWNVSISIYGDEELLYEGEHTRGENPINIGVDLQNVDTLKIVLGGYYANFVDVKFHEK